jgi:hypothetical protein
MMSIAIAIVLIVCVSIVIYVAEIYTTAPETAPETTPEEYAAKTAAAKIVCDASRKIADEFDRVSNQYQKAMTLLPAMFFIKHPIMTEITCCFKIRAEESKIVADNDEELYNEARYADVVRFVVYAKAVTDACVKNRDLSWKEYDDFRSECDEEDQQQLDHCKELKARFDTACTDAINALNVHYYANERVQR